MTGTLKIFAALASPITLLKRSWRSIDMTPKVIWGWWSMKMTVQFCGVSRLWIRLGVVDASAMRVPPSLGDGALPGTSRKEPAKAAPDRQRRRYAIGVMPGSNFG